MNTKRLKRFRKGLVIFKFTMMRGFLWCQLPALSLMGAGILFPYLVDWMPGIHLWQVAIVAFVGMAFVGWLDYKFKLLHEEQNYATKTNPTLMAGLRGRLGKKK